MPNHVFVCEENLDREGFLYQFLDQEFTCQNLYSLILSATTHITKNSNKRALVEKTIALLGSNLISPQEILRMYVQIPRM